MHAYRIPRWLLSGISACALVLLLTLSACGTNTSITGSTATQGSTSKTTLAPTMPGQTGENGCPNTTVLTTQPPAATITLKKSNGGETVNVKKGATIEVDLPFGLTWRPVNLSQNLLSMQIPAGYASTAAYACVWRFVTTNAGTADLSFTGQLICKMGQACPGDAGILVDYTLVIT